MLHPQDDTVVLGIEQLIPVIGIAHPSTIDEILHAGIAEGTGIEVVDAGLILGISVGHIDLEQELGGIAALHGPQVAERAYQLVTAQIGSGQ